VSGVNRHRHKTATAEKVQKPFYKNWLAWIGPVYVLVFLVIFLSKAKQPIPVPLFALFVMGIGLFFAIMGGHYAWNAWTKSSDEYLHWRRQQTKSKLVNLMLSALPKWYMVWSDRIGSILVTAVGLFMVLFGAYNLWGNMFGG
jgi:uncharacterized membrane protein